MTPRLEHARVDFATRKWLAKRSFSTRPQSQQSDLLSLAGFERADYGLDCFTSLLYCRSIFVNHPFANCGTVFGVTQARVLFFYDRYPVKRNRC